MIRLKLLLFTLINLSSIAAFSSLSAVFFSGSGTLADPYIVVTAEHLSNVRYYPEAHFKQVSDISLADYHEDEGWEPIGSLENPFRGLYDGAYFSISEIYISVSSLKDRVGLFGYISGAEIRDVRILGESISGNNKVGSLAGEISNRTLISGCSVEAKIKGNNNVGGIVGKIGDNSRITRSSASVEISASGSNIGGITGYSDNAGIDKSYASGRIKAEGSHVGGLVGKSDLSSHIENCYANVDVAGYGFVGGLTGSIGLEGEVVNCYSTGIVSGEEAMGGLIGYSEKAETRSSYWDIVTSRQTASAGEKGVTGAMTVAMVENSALYSGWDFNTVWALRGFTTYPYLQWQEKPGIHNYPPQGYHKVFSGRDWYWESFPVLYDRDPIGYQAGKDVLSPLTDQMSIFLTRNEVIEQMINISNMFHGQIDFKSTRGYQIALNDRNEYSFFVEGDTGFPQNIEFDAEIEISLSIPVNWLGYFIPQTQCVFSAFAEVIDDLVEIQSEDWGLYRNGFGEWVYDAGLEPKVRYGKMYKVKLHPDVKQTISFSWNILEEAEYWVPRPEPEFFSFKMKEYYESIFIDYIEDDEDVIEVAVFADNECVGATVFSGVYPFEILAYTDQSHANTVLSFALLRGDQGEETEKITQVEVKDNISGEYSQQVLRPLRQRYRVVRLHYSDFETETVVIPALTLFQNSPNPFILRGTGYGATTEISFKLSESRVVSLAVYDLHGQLVKTLFTGIAAGGKHSAVWNGLNEHNLPVDPGIYLYRLESGEWRINRKMLLLRK